MTSDKSCARHALVVNRRAQRDSDGFLRKIKDMPNAQTKTTHLNKCRKRARGLVFAGKAGEQTYTHTQNQPSFKMNMLRGDILRILTIDVAELEGGRGWRREERREGERERGAERERER